MDIYAVKIENRISRSVFDRLFSYMSSEKKERCKRFLKVEDAERMLVADILVRYYMLGKLGCKNEELLFEKSLYGKPFLKNASDRHFNVSHSGEWVIAGFDQNEIGVDVQKIQPFDLGIAERFFSKREYQDLMMLSGPSRNKHFFDLWVLKESYIKAVGKGLSIELKTIRFNIKENGVGFETENQNKNFYFKQYDIDPMYKTAICAKHGNFPKTIRRIGIDEMDYELTNRKEKFGPAQR